MTNLSILDVLDREDGHAPVTPDELVQGNLDPADFVIMHSMTTRGKIEDILTPFIAAGIVGFLYFVGRLAGI